MNRRKMLSLSAGFVLGGLAPIAIKAQDSALWFIHEDEFNTSIVLPDSKKRNKAIVTNRFDQSLSNFEKIIKKAEALYPYYTIGRETENGKPLWYSDAEHKAPYNITPKAVNYYFNLAVDNKDSSTKYIVDINEFQAVTQERRDKSELPEDVYEVSLLLNYGVVCGKLCGWGFRRLKRGFFNKKEEVIGFYMPSLGEWVS